MYLSSIELKNYRPYYGVRSINLDYDPKKNFNVIFANNAIGKSSLLNAITWAFYGRELHDRKEKENDIYNKLIRNECPIGETFEVSVTLKLFDYFDGNKKHFHVIRKVFYKKNENKAPTIDKEVLKVLDFDGIWYENDQSKIDSNISKVMHKYFFFNGEQLGEYFDNKDLKATVERISQLNVIKKVSDHLNYVKRNRFHPMISELDKDVEPILKNIEELEDEIKELNKDKEKLKSCIEKFEKQKDQIDKDLLKLEESKKLAKRRETLLEENKKLNERLDAKKGKYNEKVIELYSIISLFNILESVASIDVKIPEKSFLNQEFLKKIYEDILKEGVCLCGSDFNVNPKGKDVIKKKLETLEISIVDEESMDSYASNSKTVSEIRSLLKSIKTKHDILNDYRKDIYEIKKDLKSNKDELTSISNNFTTGDDVKISQLEITRKATYNRLQEEKENLRSIERDIETTSNKKDKCISKRDEILSNKEEVAHLRKQLDFCNNAIDIIEDLDKNLKLDILNQIKDKIQEQFVDTWSNGKFEEISVDKNYTVSLRDYLGDKILPGDLSGGEERILALSFIVALNNISGFDLPLFIDAPLTGLDDKNKSYLLNTIHDFTQNKQIIFLFIGDDYDDDIESLITPYLNKKIELVKEEEYKTIIRPYDLEKDKELVL